jgi:hypothetical protein
MPNEPFASLFRWLPRIPTLRPGDPVHPLDPYNHARSMSHYAGRTRPSADKRRAKRKAERQNRKQG